MTETHEETFPAVDVNAELNPARNKSVQPDTVSSQISTSLQMKEEAEAEVKKRESEQKEAMQTLKSAILISAVIVAVAGAAFAITKKLREK